MEQLKEVYHEESVDTVAAIVAAATLDPAEIEWMTLPPDRNEAFILHSLTQSQKVEFLDLCASFPSVLKSDDTSLMGQAKVDPYDVELIEGGEEKLNKVKSRPFPLRGPMRTMLRDAVKAMEKAGVGTWNSSGVQFASPCFFTRRP